MVCVSRLVEGGQAMTDALLPCPFCGAVPDMRFDRRHVGPDVYFVRCGYVSCGIYPDTGEYDVEARAIAAWNRRAALVEAGWRPIATAPMDGTAILGWRRKGGMRITQWSGMEWRSIPTGYTLDITHWMPLPEPPADAAKVTP
jgi:hypothetical protein